jgi:hypothetical protein
MMDNIVAGLYGVFGDLLGLALALAVLGAGGLWWWLLGRGGGR